MAHPLQEKKIKPQRLGHPGKNKAKIVSARQGPPTRRAVVLRHGARGPEQVFDVVLRIAAGGKDGDALAAEEHVFGGGVSGAVGLGEDFAAGRKVKTRTLHKNLFSPMTSFTDCPGTSFTLRRASRAGGEGDALEDYGCS